MSDAAKEERARILEKIQKMRPEYGGNPYASNSEEGSRYDGAYAMWEEILEAIEVYE